MDNQLIAETSELIQNDLQTWLDGFPNLNVTAVCQIVVDRMAEMRIKNEKQTRC